MNNTELRAAFLKMIDNVIWDMMDYYADDDDMSVLSEDQYEAHESESEKTKLA